MIVIFGWTRHGKRERPLLDTYCYRCHREVTWDWFKVSEYVTLFFVRVLPFRSEHFLVCPSCEDCVTLGAADAAGVRKLSRLPASESRALHDRLVAQLEAHQLAGKTQTQRDYIKAKRQQS